MSAGLEIAESPLSLVVPLAHHALDAYPRFEELALEAAVDGARHVELDDPTHAALLQRRDHRGEALAGILAYDGAGVWKVARKAVEDHVRNTGAVQHLGYLALAEKPYNEVKSVGEMATKRLEVERTVLRIVEKNRDELPASSL